MKSSYKKRGFAVFFVSTFAIASIMLTFIGGSEKADAQSPMDMMDMMMGGGNMTDGSMMMGDTGENMTEAELQHVMNMVICLPAMNEEMMQSMMGNGQNSTSSMMSGMMMQ